MDKLKNRIQENIHKMDVDEPHAAAWDIIKRGLSKPVEEDPLKNHFAENKNELEIETPDAASWEEISRVIITKKLAPVKPFKRIWVYASAACIVALVSLGVFRYLKVAPTDPGNDVTKKISVKDNTNTNDTINREFNTDQLAVVPDEPALPTKSLEENSKTQTAVASSKPATKRKRILLPPQVLQVEKDYDELIAGQIKYTKSLAIYGETVDYFERFKSDFKMLENQEKELRKSIAQNGLQENSIDELTMIYQQKLTVLKKLQNEINKTSNRNKNITDTIPVYLNL